MPAPPHCSARLAATHNAVNRVNLNMMDANNWRPNQSTEPNMDTSDWRGQLQPESRQRIVNKICMFTCQMENSNISGPEGLHELRRIAQRFEEKNFTAATSLNDYLRKISLKMLTMENPRPPCPYPTIYH